MDYVFIWDIFLDICEMVGLKKNKKEKINLEQRFKDMYIIDCTNCLHYQTIYERVTTCPKCKTSLHLKKILY